MDKTPVKEKRIKEVKKAYEIDSKIKNDAFVKKPSEAFRYHKKLAKQYNEGKSKTHYNIDKELSKGELLSYRIITFVFFCLTVIYGVLLCRTSYQRLWSSFKDLGNSIVYYFLMFNPDVEFDVSINDISGMNISMFLPKDFESFKSVMKLLPGRFFNLDNFLSFMLESSLGMLTFSRVLLVLVMLGISLYVLADMQLNKANGKLFQKTKKLKSFEEKVYKKRLVPVINYVADYFRFNKGHYYFALIFFVWLCNLNIMTVIVGASAWFMYFARSFNFFGLYIQAYRLVFDTAVFFSVTLWVIYVPLLYYVFHKWRIRTALKRLRGGEAHNQEFIGKRSLALIITATMGAGKTTLLTDICLSLSLMFRNQALKRMYKYFKYFPNFEWIRLRKYMDLWTKRRVVRNLATIEIQIDKLKREFEVHPCKVNLFFYDYENYRTEYHNGLLKIDIWQAIETYAKLYFIYVMETSLICSNFPIREDYFIINAGNLIKFNGDFFSKPITQETTHYSHILPYDTLRMGKALVQDAAYRNSFEFGIIAMTEGGKERGNALENLCVRQTDDECNAKNDYFETRVMMSRHPAVVDNFPFIKFLLDEQRAMTLNASFRELCEVLDIEENTVPKITVPFFYVEYAIYDILNGILGKVNNIYEVTHGNVSLTMYLFRNVLTWIVNPIERIITKFSYHALKIRVGKATSEARKEYIYFISDYKIYRDRFSTNTHNCYFRKRAAASPIGIIDYPTYTTTEMNDVELHMQGSLWIEKLDKLSNQVMTDEDLNKPEKKTKTNSKSKKRKENKMDKASEKLLEEDIEELAAIESLEDSPIPMDFDLSSIVFPTKKE